MIWFHALRKSRESWWLYGYSKSDLTPLAKALTSCDYANKDNSFPLDPATCTAHARASLPSALFQRSVESKLRRRLEGLIQSRPHDRLALDGGMRDRSIPIESFPALEISAPSAPSLRQTNRSVGRVLWFQ